MNQLDTKISLKSVWIVLLLNSLTKLVKNMIFTSKTKNSQNQYHMFQTKNWTLFTNPMLRNTPSWQLKTHSIKMIGKDGLWSQKDSAQNFKLWVMISSLQTSKELTKLLKRKLVTHCYLRSIKLEVWLNQFKPLKRALIKDGVLWFLIDQDKLKIHSLPIWLLGLELDKLRLVLHVDLKDSPNTIKLLELNRNLETKQYMLVKTLDILTKWFDLLKVNLAKHKMWFIHFV